MRPSRGWLRAGLVVLAFAALWLLLRRLPILHWVAMGANALQGAGPWGALGWAAGIYLLTLLLFPVIPLVIASGWLFGPWGALVALPPAVASAATAFLAARALGRGATARALLTHPRARTLADLAEEGGTWTVALVRISPLLPFTPGNAVMGLSGLRLRHLVAGTILGMAPGMALYAWAGSLLPNAEGLEQGEEVLQGPLVWIMLLVSFAAAALAGLAAARRLRAAARARRDPAGPAP
jgi:uncharacterized membrane protein YdjX (TVP38/TMEM64 family)